LFHSLFLSNFKNIVSLSLSKRKKQQNILDQGNHAAAIFAKLKLFFFYRSIVRSAFLLKKKEKASRIDVLFPNGVLKFRI
jgi:hypothetical protein